MDSSLVKAFIVVAQNLSFTRAAEELATSQPLLSRAMRRLEDLVGEELFDRSRRQIALTAAGEAFHQEAQGILDHIGLALRRAQMAGSGAPATLRVGYMAAMWMHTFHRGIRKFHRRFPHVALDLRMLGADEQADALRGGSIDVGLMHFNGCDRRGLTWRTIGRDQIVLALPSDWPAAPGQRIDLASLRDRPFILADPEIAPDIHDAHIECCESVGFTPRVVCYNRDGAELRFLVAAGLGAGFTFETTLLTKLDGINFVPMSNPPNPPYVDAYVVWPPGRAAANAQAFVECMTSETYFAEIIPGEDSFGLEWRRTAFD